MHTLHALEERYTSLLTNLPNIVSKGARRHVFAFSWISEFFTPGRLRGKGKCQGITFVVSMLMENLFNEQLSSTLLSGHAPSSPKISFSHSGLTSYIFHQRMSSDISGSETQFSASFFAIPTFHQHFISLPLIPCAPLHFLAMHLSSLLHLLSSPGHFHLRIFPGHTGTLLCPVQLQATAGSRLQLLCSGYSCVVAVNSPGE